MWVIKKNIVGFCQKQLFCQQCYVLLQEEEFMLTSKFYQRHFAHIIHRPIYIGMPMYTAELYLYCNAVEYQDLFRHATHRRNKIHYSCLWGRRRK